MSELYEKSIQTLELPRVLELLAEQAVSEAAKARARNLRPSDEAGDIRRRQAETGAAKHLIGLRGAPSFQGVRDVGASLQRADMGGMLNTRELLDIAGLLHAARSVRDYAGDGEEAGESIRHLFMSLRPNRFLEDKITGAIVSEDEISDGASGELSSLRRQMRSANARVREVLQKMVTSAHYAKFLQDNIITMRSDRYVVPVKAEYRGEVPGLVHDVSASGATYFIEPMSVVQANNELRDLSAREKKEIERILMELSADAAGFAEEILTDYELLSALDLIFARGQLSYRMNGSEPAIGEPGGLALRRARHPLLDPKTVVPIDLRLGSDFDTLIITGPNTGGKTVALKTIGLLSLMAQCGLHIPAGDGSRVPVYRNILADIGDEQSIEQSLSTFSSHMTNIVSILEEAGPGVLILLDELGAGTDPVEGAALAVAILQHAREKGAVLAATTHYAELKVFAMTNAGVQNASCEFDVETLRPTYRLIIGLPGKSNAFAISRRLGLPERIIENASKLLNGETARFEDVLSRLEQQRQEMEKERGETARLLRKAQEDAARAGEYRERLERERDRAAEKARADARRIVEETRRTADEIFRDLDEMKKQKSADWQAENDARTEIRRRLNESDRALSQSPEEPAPPPSSRPLRPGDTVELPAMKSRATVLSVGRDGILQLQAGILKISAREDEVRLIDNPPEQAEVKKYQQRAEQKLRTMGASPEIDLRGMTTEEAADATDRFLDDAAMGRLTTVTIIHGKGTGALRAAVHARLRSNPAVKDFRLGRYGEGENGVTIAELK